MPNATCPSEEELALYTVGRMPLDHVEEIAEHIDQCPDCQAALVELPEPRDSLVEQIREPAPAVEPIEDPACLAALSRAKALMSESAAINGDETIETRPPDAVRTLGEYELLAKLGEGGMGAVYRARHTKLQRIVALKLLSKHRMEDERAVARFEREMAAVGQLTHPNVVQAHDAREIDGTPILGMEYVEGVDLSKLAARVGPLPVTDACEIVRQAAVGLQAIHEHGLVHRDVKPSNLMLTPEGQVKILDLGLARLAGEGITATLIAWQITVRIRRPDGTEQIVEAPAKSQVTIEHRQSTAVDDQTRPPTHTQRVSTEHSPLDDLEGDVMEVGCFEGHRDAITDVEFWPDEKTLASASCDGTVRLWDMVTGEELKRIRVDNGDLKDVAFCSDGRHFAAANGGMTAQLWDIESEKLVRHFEGHSDGVDVVSFLPDGNRVVSGSGGDRTIRVWDVATGRQVRQFTQQESKTLRVLSASPDGRHLAVARDGEDCVHLYALDGLIPPQVFDCGQRVYSVSFSPDGTAILATGSSPHPKLIDLATGELLSDMPLPQDVAGERYHYGTFDPTGRLALVASQYGLLRLWDSGTRRLWQSQPLAHITPGSSLSRDGSLFATGDEYGYVRIFMLPWPDASFPLPANNAPGGFETHDRVRPVGEVCVVGERSGMPAFSMPAFSMSISERLFTRMDWRGFLYVELGPGGHVLRRMHLGGRHNGCLSPDGQSILCWGNGRLFMVNTITGRETWSLQGFGGPGSFSPNDSLMLALQNNQPIVLDATSGAPLCTMEGASGSVSSGSMIVSPNGRYAAVAGCGGIPMLWKMPATIEEARLLGRAGAIGPLHILGTKQYNHVSCRIAFSADSRLLAVAGPDEMVCVWNVASGVEQSSFSAHEGGARAVAIAPDGGRILTGGEDGTIILWNADNTTEVLRLRGYHTAVNKLAFSADGRFAVSAANDASVRIWRLPPADEQGPFEVEVGEVGCLYAKDMRFEQAMLFSDGRRALETTKINEQTLTLWDVETGSEVRRFEGHTGDLTHLAVSPDEDLIVAADGEQVLAWKTETGELVHRFRGGGPFAFTPDGKTLFGGGDKPDGTRKSTDAADIHQDRAKGTGGSCWPGFDAEARLPSPFASHINRSLPLCRTSVHTETSIRHHTSRQHTRRRRRRNCPQLFRLLTPFAHLLRYARMVRDVTILQILTGVKKVSGTFCAKHLEPFR